MKADGHTGKYIAKFLGVSRATLYRYLDEDSAACVLGPLLREADRRFLRRHPVRSDGGGVLSDLKN